MIFNLLHVKLVVCNDNRNRLASRVLCATLAVPLPAARNQSDQLLDLDDGGVEKQKRLAALLSLTSLPTRQTLVKELVSTANSLVIQN